MDALALPLFLLTSGPARRDVDLDALAREAARARDGDHQAFRAVVERTTPVVYRLALRSLGHDEDACDAVQETFLRVWRGISRLDDPQACLGFVCTVARGAIADRHRARGRRRERDHVALDAHGAEIVERLASPDVDAAEVLASREARAIVRAIIETLPEKFRVVLLLKDIDGLTADEVASALGVPVGTVESRVSRARRALAKEIDRRAGRRRWPW